MSVRIRTVLEHPTEGWVEDVDTGAALARVAEAHPALAPLLDFSVVDPTQIALEVGMVYPYEEDGADDLGELDLGPTEWFEPSAGLLAVRQAREAVRDDPGSIARAVYDPTLRPEDVLADLEAVEQTLRDARQRETRFHFLLDAPLLTGR